METETHTGQLTAQAPQLARILAALTLYTGGPDQPNLQQARITPLLVENNATTLLLEATDGYAAIRIYLNTESHTLPLEARTTFNPSDVGKALKAAGINKNGIPVTLAFTAEHWELDSTYTAQTGQRHQINEYPNTAQIWQKIKAGDVQPHAIGTSQLARLAKVGKLLGDDGTPIQLVGNSGSELTPHLYTIESHGQRAEIIQMPIRTNK